MVVVSSVLAVAWGLVSYRLCSLHLGSNPKLHAKIEQLRPINEEISAPRGRILDVRGHILAMDMPVRNVCIDPAMIRSSTNGMAAKVVAALASALQMEPAMIWPKLQQTNSYAVIRKYVPVDATEVFTNSRLKGVILEEVSRRNYPRESLACHVIGYAAGGGGSSGATGSSGIELHCEKYLRGVPGVRVSEKDGKKNELVTHRVVEVDPQRGNDVYLTIDQNLQYIVEKALDTAMEKNHAKGAWAILERVKTGEVLAMASRPDFNPNDYANADTNNFLNRAIGFCYEPGSTFKMATIAAALDAGTVRPDTTINCENGVWIYMGKPLRDFHPHGVQPVANVIKYSSNIGAAKIALTLGSTRLHEYLEAFHIGRRSGIPLAGEEGGLLHDLRRWTALSITRVPMGHEVMVTSIQVLDVINAIANDGFLIKPQIIDRIITPQGNAVYARQTEVIGHPIRPDTAKLMRKLLTRVTEKGGTASHASFDGYTVAGKTGTAQKLVDGHYSDTLNIASFVGIVPAEKPELALIVVVDEPGISGEHTGGVVCVPVFREVMEQAVRYLDVPAVPAEMAWRFGDEIPNL